METTRQEKIASLIQKELAEQLRVEGNYLGAMITVTKVNITPDLGLARVYLSIFGTENKKAIVDRVSAKASEIRFDLAKKTRHQLRIIPGLEFFLDDSLDYIDKIDELLKK